MQTAQYWKPGEKKPRDGGSGPESASKVKERGKGKGKKGEKRGDHTEQHSTSSSNGNRGGSAKKRGKKSKGEDDTEGLGSSTAGGGGGGGGGIDAEVSRAATKPPVAGPSQGLLAMKFMQRKVKADEAQKQQQDRRDRLERDFSTLYAKRLRGDNTNAKDRLLCRLDEQDPALVVVGRRSFGGFNAVAEAAYDACVRDIAAGERLGQLGREDRSGGGISDTEMAETLGRNVHSAGRR